MEARTTRPDPPACIPAPGQSDASRLRQGRSSSVVTKVVILAGGLGTRLTEETESRPKPIVEIGGKPILGTSCSPSRNTARSTS
jgi:hypothetical protein